MAQHTDVEPQATAAESSEGSVMLAFCVAGLVALGALYLGRPAPADHLDAHDTHSSHEALLHGDHETHGGRTAFGRHGAVAAAAPEASQAGLEILEKGGNAFDAMIAASFTVSVVRPQSTGIGGGGFVVWHGAEGDHGVLDGRERAPLDASRDMYQDKSGQAVADASRNGPLAGGVPGLVSMLWTLYREHGSGNVTWSELVAPAIRYAEDGFVVPSTLAHAIAARQDVLRRYESSADVFLPNNRPPAAGDILTQPELGQVLRKIAQSGADGFYRGGVAERIARGVRQNGGLISMRDLAAYETTVREPVVGQYRGHTIISMPPPSSGGVHMVQMFNMLAQDNLKKLGWHSTAHLHLLAETMRRAFADRSEYLGDADFVDVPVAELTDPAYAQHLRAQIDMDAASSSADVRPGNPVGYESDQTTHISVVDKLGNAVSSTQTINTSLGSGFVIPGTGILLNNEMDDFAAKPGEANYFGLVQGERNAIAPRKRPLSSMSPTIVLDREGHVRLVVGSPGGPRIITATFQVISNVIDFDLPLHEAVAAPRIHHQWLPDQLLADSELPHVRDLGALGHDVLVGSRVLGNVQAVLVDHHGHVTAASDPRGTGRPAAH